MRAPWEAFELPHEPPGFLLPVPGLAVCGFGLLLIATAHSLDFLWHGADDLKARGSLVAAVLGLHSDVDEHLQAEVQPETRLYG